MKKQLLKATSTPLASIFGSGFLIIIPILAGAVGPYSIWAVIIMCLFAFLIGSILRFNIRNAEPVIKNKTEKTTLRFENVSDVAISLAYIISVCLYLKILATFVLGSLQIDTTFNQNILATSILILIVIVGYVKGLDKLEVIEQWALYITLLIVVLLILAFVNYDIVSLKANTLQLPKTPNHTPWEIITIVSGTLIVFQGFETPRYLGATYDADTRIKASRLSQIISIIIYILLVALALPIVTKLNGVYKDNSLTTITKIASSVLVVPLIIAAALSQFSASIADTIAAADNMEELSGKRIKEKFGYLIVGVGAVFLVWLANTEEIIALASKAFAFYYMLQCVVAITVSKSRIQKLGILLLAMLLMFIVLFAVPAA